MPVIMVEPWLLVAYISTFLTGIVIVIYSHFDPILNTIDDIDYKTVLWEMARLKLLMRLPASLPIQTDPWVSYILTGKYVALV